MDPVTILALTSAAFNGVKKAIAVGREAQDIYSQLSKWASHAGNLTEAINKSSRPGAKVLGSVTGQAFDIMAAKAQLQQMEKEIHHMFTYGELQELGSAGYHEFIQLRKKLREDREAAEKEKLRRRAKLLENAFWGSILAVVLALGIYLTGIFYELGSNAGRW
jgi:cell division protein FtsL